TKSIDKVIDRFKVLVKGKDKAGEFYRKSFAGLFAYVSNRIPEITDDLYKIDDAMKAGFGWEHGPFQIWDAVGVQTGLNMIKEAGEQAATWVEEMLTSGNSSFYTIKDGSNYYYDISSKSQKKIPGQDTFIILDNIRNNKKVWGNAETTLHDLGDGILNLEFHSKMNAIGGGVISGINKAIEIAEKEYEGLVIGNQAVN